MNPASGEGRGQGDIAAAAVRAAAARAVSLVSISLPHLSGMAHVVRIVADDRVPTAGVFASGRLLVNPGWFLGLSLPERAFVVGHELLHLALGSHERMGHTDAARFNLVHDLIINDMLEAELGMQPPGGGVRLPGARNHSVEALLLAEDLPQGAAFAAAPAGDRARDASQRAQTNVAAALRDALAAAGRDLPDDATDGPGGEDRPADLLGDELESAWFPADRSDERTAARKVVADHAASSAATRLAQHAGREVVDVSVRHAHRASFGGRLDDGIEAAYVDALISAYQPPWELAVHRWIDTVSTPRRTFSRASRRGADRTDISLPGRDRAGRTLSIVLDTSGSMTDELAYALGSIMVFSRGAQIATVRLLQCDTQVTADDVVDIEDLASYEVLGFGGSDMGPAMQRLAQDPEATAVIVITDGYIVYPKTPMPYDVLWVLTGDARRRFAPPYGHVLQASSQSTPPVWAPQDRSSAGADPADPDDLWDPDGSIRAALAAPADPADLDLAWDFDDGWGF